MVSIQPVQWGIIGCGDVTEVKSGPAFNKVLNSKLVAVMRRNAEKAEDYAKRHGVPKWYCNAKELIDDPEVNAIYIATPPLQHEEYTIAALEAGKPVYVEKPMAVNATAAQRMAEAVQKTGVKLSVAHYRRAQPLFRKIKELVDEKRIGDVRFVNLQLYQPFQPKKITQTETNWRIDPAISGGGLFYDLAPHQLDLMIYLFGSAKEAKGISLNAGKHYKADDTTAATILFQNDILFSGTWSFAAPMQEAKDHCEIIGSKGKISFSVFEQKPVIVDVDDQTETFYFDPLPHVQQPMIASVVDYFISDSLPNPCSVKDGLEVMELMQRVTEKSG